MEEQFDERMEEMSERVKDLEKKLLACGKTKNENKFVPASPVPITASPVSVKLYTYDGKTNWEVYKIQFGVFSESNRWTEGVKACQLVASLREEAAEVLQTLTDTELLNLNSVYNALIFGFVQTRGMPNSPSQIITDMLDWRKIWGSDRLRKGSNSAETVL
ncbi:uncharacterized protein TNCV_3698841 [Trichonephila clavipes]|uniref:Uncharacterized protein n=1 Tax=Trichonephila clavipes TaxID=2585209 RepID=A0A8X6V9F8_TRICX|nr:uncharacterized protein TNCV_3698841 [Trichonephila clavipes]